MEKSWNENPQGTGTGRAVTLEDIFNEHDAVCFDRDDGKLIEEAFYRDGPEEAERIAEELEEEYLAPRMAHYYGRIWKEA